MNGRPPPQIESASSWEPEDEPRLLEILRDGELELQGLLSWGSNYVFLGRVESAQASAAVVYKPTRGERPLTAR